MTPTRPFAASGPTGVETTRLSACGHVRDGRSCQATLRFLSDLLELRLPSIAATPQLPRLKCSIPPTGSLPIPEATL